MSKILYVEDNAFMQMDGEASLIAAGYDVVLASTGQEACAYLREHGVSLDALITDIDLPGGFKGWQVASLGREIAAGLPVVYVTGTASAQFAQHGVSDSVMMPKPFDWDDLIKSLAALAPAA